MTDIFTRKKRSAVMSAIRSRGNAATELRLIALFRAHGITGWRRGSKLTGKPDFVFPRLPASPRLRRTGKLAVFVDGCFWHGCPRHATRPKTNAAFWRKKIAANQARDPASLSELCRTRPSRHPHAAIPRLARLASVGARACPQE